MESWKDWKIESVSIEIDHMLPFVTKPLFRMILRFLNGIANLIKYFVSYYNYVKTLHPWMINMDENFQNILLKKTSESD